MSRIAGRFAELKVAGRKALIPYIMAGDPLKSSTVPLLHGLVEAGSDILEIGVPFSDPMADGPVIQRSSARAVAAGTSLRRVLELVSEPQPALVLELVEGASLLEALDFGRAPAAGERGDALRLQRLIAFLARLLDALDAVHAAGLVHRDVKPDNVRVTPTGAVKLLDLGLASGPGEAAAAGRPAVHRRALAEHVAVADLDPRVLAAVLEVLGHEPDRREREEAVVLPDPGVAVDHDVRLEHGSAAEPDAGTDDAERPDPHAGLEPRAGRHARERIHDRLRQRRHLQQQPRLGRAPILTGAAGVAALGVEGGVEVPYVRTQARERTEGLAVTRPSVAQLFVGRDGALQETSLLEVPGQAAQRPLTV